LKNGDRKLYFRKKPNFLVVRDFQFFRDFSDFLDFPNFYPVSPHYC